MVRVENECKQKQTYGVNTTIRCYILNVATCFELKGSYSNLWYKIHKGTVHNGILTYSMVQGPS